MMERCTSQPHENGIFYDAGGEPIRRVVGRPRHYSDLGQLVRQMRENLSFLLGKDVAKEVCGDEAVREVVARFYPHLIHLLPDVSIP